jgi:phosphoribosylformylglycinamidine (FGAM) synthase PurS component
MPKIELMVELLIPDTTAITAFHTLERMGFSKLKKLKRANYYVFETKEDFKKFSEQVKKIDILVNANKHKAMTKLAEEPFSEAGIRVLVKDTDDKGEGLLNTLKNRLGLKADSVQKGTLWTMEIEGDDKSIAKKITEELLSNSHYQDYSLF